MLNKTYANRLKNMLLVSTGIFVILLARMAYLQIYKVCIMTARRMVTRAVPGL